MSEDRTDNALQAGFRDALGPRMEEGDLRTLLHSLRGDGPWEIQKWGFRISRDETLRTINITLVTLEQKVPQ